VAPASSNVPLSLGRQTLLQISTLSCKRCFALLIQRGCPVGQLNLRCRAIGALLAGDCDAPVLAWMLAPESSAGPVAASLASLALPWINSSCDVDVVIAPLAAMTAQ